MPLSAGELRFNISYSYTDERRLSNANPEVLSEAPNPLDFTVDDLSDDSYELVKCPYHLCG